MLGPEKGKSPRGPKMAQKNGAAQEPERDQEPKRPQDGPKNGAAQEPERGKSPRGPKMAPKSGAAQDRLPRCPLPPRGDDISRERSVQDLLPLIIARWSKSCKD